MGVRTSDQACRALKHKGFFKLHLHVMFVGLVQQICICCSTRDTSRMTTNSSKHTVVRLLENVNTLTIWRSNNNVKAHICPASRHIPKSTAWSEIYQASSRLFLLILVSISVWASVEWYWQEETDVRGENSVPLPLYPTQISDVVARYRKRDAAVRGRQLKPPVPRHGLLKTKLVCVTYICIIQYSYRTSQKIVCFH